MKRIIVMTAGLVGVAAGVVGCLSAQLRSEDPQTRLAAVGEVKEQAVLQEIAQGAQYQDDVRVAAMKRLSDPQDLWRIWSENEGNPEIARGALDAFKDDDYLVRVSLSPRTNEALVAVGRLSSLSACSNVAVNCTVPSVQLAAFRKFLEQTQDEDALRYALEHGGMRGAGVKYAPETPEGARSVEDENRLLAIKRIIKPKTLFSVANESSGAAAHYAFGGLVHRGALNDVVMLLCAQPASKFLSGGENGDISDASAEKFVDKFPDARQHIVLARDAKSFAVAKAAVARITDVRVLSELLATDRPDMPACAFARLRALKAFDACVDALCNYPVERLTSEDAEKVVAKFTDAKQLDRLARDAKSFAVAQAAVARVTDAKVLSELVASNRPDMPACAFARLLDLKAFGEAADALCTYPVERLTSEDMEKVVAKFTDAKLLEKFARGAKSPSVVKAAVAQISDDNVLFEVARDAKDEDLFKQALGRIEDQKVFESITLAGGERSDYAISLLKDGAYVLSLLGKGETGAVRSALAKKLDVKDISAEMCEKEKDGAVREILRARASDDVKAGLVQRRKERIKKAIAVAENDAKELGAIFAKGEMSKDNARALAKAYKGRAILFKKAKVEKVGSGRDASGKNAKIVTFAVENPYGPTFRPIAVQGTFGEKAATGLAKDQVVTVLGVVEDPSDEASVSIGDAAVASGDDVSGLEASLDGSMSDEALDSMADETGESAGHRFAESQGLKVPDPEVLVAEAKQRAEEEAQKKKAAEKAAKVEKEKQKVKGDGAEGQASSVASDASAESAAQVLQKIREEFKTPEKAVSFCLATLTDMLKKSNPKLYWTLTLFPLVVGMLMLLFGQRHFKKLLFLVIAYAVYFASSELLPLVMPLLKSVRPLADKPEVVAVGGAVVIGLVLAILYPIFMVFMGVLPVAIAAVACGVDVAKPDIVWAVAGGVCALLALFFYKRLKIPVSAVVGAVLVMVGIVFLQKWNLRPYVVLGIIGGLALWGIFVQCAFTARRKPKKGAAKPDGQDGQPPPSPPDAPTGPGVPTKTVAPRTPSILSAPRRFSGPVAPKRKVVAKKPRPLKPTPLAAPAAPAEPEAPAELEPVAPAELESVAPAEPVPAAPAADDVPDLPEVADLPETPTAPES